MLFKSGKELTMKYYAIFRTVGKDYFDEPVEHMCGICTEPEKAMLVEFQFADEKDRFVEITEAEYSALDRVFNKAFPECDPDFGEMYGGEEVLMGS